MIWIGRLKDVVTFLEEKLADSQDEDAELTKSLASINQDREDYGISFNAITFRESNACLIARFLVWIY